MSAIPTSTNIYVTSNNSTSDIITDFSAYSTIQPADASTATNITVLQNDLNQIFVETIPLGSSTSGILTNINSNIQGNKYDLGQLFYSLSSSLSGVLPFTIIGDYSYTYDYTAHTYYITFNTIGGIQFNNNLSNVQMIVVGGGGAGGGCDITTTGSCGAGGGGGGAISLSTSVTNNPLTGLVTNNMYYINVGTGGNGVASGSGLAGGTSYFVDMSGTALITSTGGQGGSKTNTNIVGGLGGSSTYTSIFTPTYSTVTSGYGGTGGKNDNGTVGIGGFGTQCSLSYQNYLNNFVLKTATNLKNSLSFYNYFLFSGGGGGATDSATAGAGYFGSSGLGIYKANGGTYGYSTTMISPIARASTNYYLNQMPTSSINVSGAVSGLCPGAGGGGIGSSTYTTNQTRIGGNGSPGTVKISFSSYSMPNLSNLFNISGNVKQYSISLANGSQYYLVYCYPGQSTITIANNIFLYGASILGIGGGGGGGGGGFFTANATNTPGTFISGAGGGGGGTCLIGSINLFGTYNITVGAGGSGGFGGSIKTSAINGSIGGNTTIINGSANILTCTGGKGGNAFLDVCGGIAGTVQCNYSYIGGQGGAGGSGGKGYNGTAGSNNIPLSGSKSSLISYSLPDGTIIYCGGGGGGGSARYSDSQYVSGVPKTPLNYNGGAAGYGYGGLVGTCINSADPSLNILDSSANGGNGIFWGSGGGGGSSNAPNTNTTFGGSGGDGAVIFLIPANGIAQLNSLQQNIVNASNALSSAQTALANYNPTPTGYNNWFSPSSINNNANSWVGIGIADNGYIFVSSFNIPIFISGNYASTFSSIPVGTGHREIAISANGQYGIVCNPGPYYIYTTSNFGTTWVQTANNGRWQTVAASSTCQYSILGTNGEGLYYSNNYGTTYTISNIYDGRSQLAMSSTGQYCLASYHSGTPFTIASTGQIYYSNNYGQSWSASNSPVANWGKCVIEDNGIGYAVNYADYIYKTTNYGQTWSAIISSGALGWSMVYMDSSGQNLLGAQNATPGYVYFSSNYGASWNQTNCPYMNNIVNMCISRNGKFAGVCGYNDYVYFSSFSSEPTTSNSQLVENVNSAQIAYNNAVYAYNNNSSILSTTSVMPLAPTVNSISNIGYNVTSGISNYGLYSLPDTYTAGISNIITNKINSAVNGSINIYNFLYNTNYYNYLIGYDNTGISTIQSVSALLDISMSYISNTNTIIPSNGLPTTGTSYSIASNPTGQYLVLCIYGGSVYNSTDYGKSWTINSTFSTANFRSICSYNNGNSYTACIYGGNITWGDDFPNWTPRASSQYWTSIASSSDGTKLAAVVNGGFIWTSTDSGVNWTPRASSQIWTSIASSSDGKKLAAVVNTGFIWTSTDSGLSWTNRTSSEYWRSIASSSDGTTLAAIVEGGYIWTSTDSGLSWRQRANYQTWYSIASSSDGTKLAAVVTGGYIWTSTDSGFSWTERTSSTPKVWQSIASSSDGTKLAAVVLGGFIWTSTDLGVNWTPRASFQNWQSIASSSDGTKLAAGVYGGFIWTSTDSGVSWTQRTSSTSKYWYSIAYSSDGTKLAAGVYGGFIYRTTIVQISNAPVANWTSICSDISGINFAACIDNSGIYISTDSGSSFINTNAPSSRWTSICCNNNGTKFFACSNGSGIYNSTTSPTTWSQSYSSISNFTSICSDITGTYIYSCVNGGKIYSSSNSGSTWIQTSSPTSNWSAIKCNSTGSTIAAAINNGPIWISINSGSSWIQTESPQSSWTSLSLDSTGTYLTGISTPLYAFTFTNNNGTLQTNLKIQTVTSSFSGKILLACVYGSGISLSTNYGASWSLTTAPTKNWYSICSDASGQRLAACIDNSGIYTSSDSGTTWVNRSVPSANWRSICSDVSGINLAACIDSSNIIYTSSTSGSTWIPNIVTLGSWKSICSDYTGKYLAACINGSGIYISSNSGSTWTNSSAPSNNWISICSNSTGKYLAACINGSSIYNSSNYGSTWNQTSAPTSYWVSIACDSTGSIIVACINNGLIYCSSDYGLNWSQLGSSNIWTSISISANGTLVTASTLNGTIYNYSLPSLYTLQKPTIGTITGNSVIINYTAVVQARSYAVYIHTTNTFTPLTSGVKYGTINSTTSSSILVSGLTSITNYYAMVIGYTLPNQQGIAFQSPYTDIFTTVLNTPNAPTFNSITPTTVTLNYTSVPNATSYGIYVYASTTFTPSTSGVLSNYINSTTSGTVTISGLTSGTRYYGLVIAYTGQNATGISSQQSNYSSVLVYLTTPDTPYFSYANVSVIYFTTILGALSYGIYVSTSTSFTPTMQGVISQTQNSLSNGSIDFTNSLTNGNTYYAIIVAYDSLNATGGSSPQSGYSSGIFKTSLTIKGSNSDLQFPTPVTYNNISYKIIYITSGSDNFFLPSTTVAMVLVGGGGSGLVTPGAGGKVSIVNNPPIDKYFITIGNGGTGGNIGGNTTMVSSINTYTGEGGLGGGWGGRSSNGTNIVYNNLYYGGGGGGLSKNGFIGGGGGGGGEAIYPGGRGGGINTSGLIGGAGGAGGTSNWKGGSNGTDSTYGGGGGGGGYTLANGIGGSGGNGGGGGDGYSGTNGNTTSNRYGGSGGGGNGGMNTGGGGGYTSTSSTRGGSGIVLIIYT